MALVGTGDVRTWLSLEDEDKDANAKISATVNAIEGFIERQCNRKFEAKLYKTDMNDCYFDGAGLPFILLPQFPVWYVNEANVDADRAFGAATQIATDDLILYEKEGKVVSEAGRFSRGRKNVYIEYYAGYAAGTHVSHDGFGTVGYAAPNDLKQVIIEMTTETMKEGITAVHTVAGERGEIKMMQMLNGNSMWRNTINSYKNYAAMANYGYYST